MSGNLNYKAIIGKKRQKGYCAMRRGHSCVLGMKTQCMRTKSSTAGSDRTKGNDRKREGKKAGKGRVIRFQMCRAKYWKCPESPVFFIQLVPGSLGCMSTLMDSRKCSRIFSGVPEITVYLQKAGEHVMFFLPEHSRHNVSYSSSTPT